MIKLYEELAEEEQSKLSHAWAQIYGGLKTYEEVTGADNLDNIIYEEIWDAIGYQKSEEE